MDTHTNGKVRWFSLQQLVVSLVFGAIALLIVTEGIHFPIPGTEVVTDPRESFTTLGSALVGPVGAVIIGFMAGIREPGGIAYASLLAHISGALWMSIIYKVVYRRFTGVMLGLAWILSVVAYYFGFAVTGFAVGLTVFYHDKTPVREAQKYDSSQTNRLVSHPVVISRCHPDVLYPGEHYQ